MEELIKRESLKYHITGFVYEIILFLSIYERAVLPLSVVAVIKVKVLHCMTLEIPVITASVGVEGIYEIGEV